MAKKSKTYCSKCGAEVAEDQNFCTVCGNNLRNNNKSVDSKSIEGVDGSQLGYKLELAKESKTIVKAKPASTLGKVAGVIGALIALAVGRYLGLALLVFFIITYLPYFLGKKLSMRFIKKGFISKRAYGFLAWSNILTWLLPPLGIFTATATLILIKNSKRTPPKSYKVLAIFCIIALIINGIFGVVGGYYGRKDNQELQQEKTRLDKVAEEVKSCQNLLNAQRNLVNQYSQSAIDAFNASIDKCNNLKAQYDKDADAYNSRVKQ